MKRVVPFALAAAVLLPARAQAHCHIPRDSGVCYDYLSTTFSSWTREKGVQSVAGLFAPDATLLDDRRIVNDGYEAKGEVAAYLEKTYSGTTYSIVPHSMFIQDLAGDLVVADWEATVARRDGTPFHHHATLLMRTREKGEHQVEGTFLALRLVPRGPEAAAKAGPKKPAPKKAPPRN